MTGFLVAVLAASGAMDPIRVESWTPMQPTIESLVPPEVVAALRAATAAEPFVCHTTTWADSTLRDSDVPGAEVLRYGACMDGAALEAVVSALLDDSHYREQHYGHAFLMEGVDGVPPAERFGLAFYGPGERVVITAERDFLWYRFHEPRCLVIPLSIAPWVLGDLAHDTFPEVEWQPLARSWR